MTHHPFPDGVIELGIGDSMPPGHVGQHTNVNHPWYRIAGGEWKRAARSLWKTYDFLSSSETCAEFEQLVEWYNRGEI